MTRILTYFQRYIVIALMILMMVVVAVSTIELGILIVMELIRTPTLQLGVQGALELFGFFFMILIGLELMHTIELYLAEDHLHVEIVFLVAMIAVSRKVIILDYKTLSPLVLLGIAATILALATGYYLVRRSTQPAPPTTSQKGQNHESV